MEFTAKQIAEFLCGKVEGDETVRLHDLAKIEEATEGQLTFLSNKKYTHFIYTTNASAVLVDEDFVPEQPLKPALIRVKSAYESLAKLLQLADSMKPSRSGVHSTAVVDSTATIGKDVYIGPYAVIGANARIADKARIYPHCFLDNGVCVGEGSTIYAGVKVYENCVIGNRCIIHAGAVIGADGFGFAPDAEGHYNKIPQLGNVVLEDDVEIGANTTIDCATMGSTVIHRGVKIDNLCQIAHNVVVGEDTAMAAQCGIAGSTKIGQHCVLGGQTGIVGHVEVADRSVFGAKTAVTGYIKQPGKTWGGFPEMEVHNFRKAAVLYRRLPDLYDRINELEKKIKDLEK